MLLFSAHESWTRTSWIKLENSVYVCFSRASFPLFSALAVLIHLDKLCLHHGKERTYIRLFIINWIWWSDWHQTSSNVEQLSLQIQFLHCTFPYHWVDYLQFKRLRNFSDRIFNSNKFSGANNSTKNDKKSIFSLNSMWILNSSDAETTTKRRKRPTKTKTAQWVKFHCFCFSQPNLSMKLCEMLKRKSCRWYRKSLRLQIRLSLYYENK